MPEQAIEKLSDEQIEAALAKRPDWSNVAGNLQRTFQFGSFVGSMSFVRKIAEYAERVQHHPDILIRYNRVTLTVSTHDAGGITQKDFDLAAEADSLAG